MSAPIPEGARKGDGYYTHKQYRYEGNNWAGERSFGRERARGVNTQISLSSCPPISTAVSNCPNLESSQRSKEPIDTIL